MALSTSYEKTLCSIILLLLLRYLYIFHTPLPFSYFIPSSPYNILLSFSLSSFLPFLLLFPFSPLIPFLPFPLSLSSFSFPSPLFLPLAHHGLPSPDPPGTTHSPPYPFHFPSLPYSHFYISPPHFSLLPPLPPLPRRALSLTLYSPSSELHHPRLSNN